MNTGTCVLPFALCGDGGNYYNISKQHSKHFSFSGSELALHIVYIQSPCMVGATAITHLGLFPGYPR